MPSRRKRRREAVDGHVIAQHIQANCLRPLRLRDLARKFGRSDRACQAALRRDMHRTFTSLLKQSRMARARLLLRRGQKKLVEVAAACGYRSTRGLRRAFVAWHGVTPSGYRQNRERYRGRWTLAGRRLLMRDGALG